MTLSPEDRAKVEAYASSLLAAAEAEGRELEELAVIDHLAESLDDLSDTMSVIVEQGDTHLLPLIRERYNALFRATEVDATLCDVTTAIPLDDELRAEIEEFLRAEYDGPVEIVEHVDPKIIGGIIVSALGERKDASVRTQLENARAALKGAREG